ncbi:8035_t:CDS:2, partial [Gigaspora margarita]
WISLFMDEHWSTNCTGNAYCDINYKDYIELKSRSDATVNIIAQKWLEYMYRPEGLTATELALHYKLLWAVQEEMRQ